LSTNPPSGEHAAAKPFTQCEHVFGGWCPNPSFEGQERAPSDQANLVERLAARDTDCLDDPSAMRVRVSQTACLDELAEHLRSRRDTVVERIAEDELEVSLVGSLDASTMQMEIYRRIRAWESGADRSGVSVEVVPSVGGTGSPPP
jgi:hypothetical protein